MENWDINIGMAISARPAFWWHTENISDFCLGLNGNKIFFFLMPINQP